MDMKNKYSKVIIGVALVAGALAAMKLAEKSARKQHDASLQALASVEAPASTELVGAEISPFSMLAEDEQRLDSKDLEDKVWLASFLFTSCESMCPLIAKKLQGIQEAFHEHPGFRLLSFSLDPVNDTPLRLKAYAKKYQADPRQWRFLTGGWTEIKELMIKGFRVVAPDQPASHTDRLVLVDRHMKIFAYYAANDPADSERLTKDIKKLLKL